MVEAENEQVLERHVHAYELDGGGQDMRLIKIRSVER